MKGFLILLLFALIIGTGVVFVQYAPVCSVTYACPVRTDSTGKPLITPCSPTVQTYQNKYQAYLMQVAITHIGECTVNDKVMRRI